MVHPWKPSNNGKKKDISLVYQLGGCLKMASSGIFTNHPKQPCNYITTITKSGVVAS